MIQLLHGDCLELMKDIPDKSIDMILCDLPYGLTHCDWDIPLDMESMWEGYKRIIKDNGAILLFSIQPFTSDLIQSNRKMFRYEIVWQKTQPSGFLNAKRMPLRNHEIICVFYKHLPTYNPQKRKVQSKQIGRKKVNGTKAKQYNDYIVGKWEWTETGERMPTDVITFSNWNGALFGKTDKAVKHPTQKPVPLLEYLIKTYTNEGDTVLDNCMGSGSTGVACVNLNRDFIGMELSQEYFNIATERINDAFDGTKVDEADCTEYDIGYNDGIDFAVNKLSVLPSAQPVIRCKDCKHFGGGTYCHERDDMWDENDFCSYAERRGEEDEDE